MAKPVMEPIYTAPDDPRFADRKIEDWQTNGVASNYFSILQWVTNKTNVFLAELHATALKRVIGTTNVLVVDDQVPTATKLWIKSVDEIEKLQSVGCGPVPTILKTARQARTHNFPVIISLREYRNTVALPWNCPVLTREGCSLPLVQQKVYHMLVAQIPAGQQHDATWRAIAHLLVIASAQSVGSLLQVPELSGLWVRVIVTEVCKSYIFIDKMKQTAAATSP